MIRKMKLNPVNHIVPNNNFHNTETIIQESKLKCNKPEYFYTKKKVMNKTDDFEIDYSTTSETLPKLINPYENNKNNNKNLDTSKIQNQKFTFDRNINICSELRGNCSRLENKNFNFITLY